MNFTLYSFLGIAWKLGLGLAAFTCGRRAVRLRAQAIKAQSAIKLLTERVRGGEELLREELEARERVEAEVDFWRRMEKLAREELKRKDRTLQEMEEQLKGRARRTRELETQLAALAEREAAVVRERDCLRQLLDKQGAGAGPEDTPPILAASSPTCSTPLPPLDTDAVVQMVRTLNNEISRAAALMTNGFRADGVRHGATFAAAYERTRQTVGPIMAELLESVQHQEDPILVHVALQTDMVGFAAEIVSAWDFQHMSNSVFAGIYRQMLASETQCVAGRWRALTRKYSKQRLYNGRDLTADFTQQLAERMSAIFVVSGASGGLDDLEPTILPSLENIIRLSLALQTVLGEDIVAGDFEAFVVRVDEVFDPELMEDVYSEENALHSAAERELHVLCTASLGLRHSVKTTRGEDANAMRVSLALKPKVVLETLVYDLGLIDEVDDDSEISLSTGTESSA